jgi:hypothetical protein
MIKLSQIEEFIRTRPFRRFYIKTAGGNYVEVSGTDGLVHHHRLATEHGGSIYSSLRSV